jgi:hypothetical protein
MANMVQILVVGLAPPFETLPVSLPGGRRGARMPRPRSACGLGSRGTYAPGCHSYGWERAVEVARFVGVSPANRPASPLVQYLRSLQTVAREQDNRAGTPRVGVRVGHATACIICHSVKFFSLCAPRKRSFVNTKGERVFWKIVTHYPLVEPKQPKIVNPRPFSGNLCKWHIVSRL